MSNNLSAANAHRTIAGIYGIVFFILAIFIFAASKESPLRSVLFVVVLAAFFIGLHLFVARGAESCKPWARVASIIMGVLFLPGIPVGTALGIWLLSNSLSPWIPAKKYSGSLADGWPQPQRDSA